MVQTLVATFVCYVFDGTSVTEKTGSETSPDMTPKTLAKQN